MRCQLKLRHMRKALVAIQPANQHDEDYNHMGLEGYLRVELDAGMLRLRGPYGNAEIPAQIERRGVLFVGLREFIDAMSNVKEASFVFDATPELVRAHHFALLTLPELFIIFDDPATAPDTWVPSDRSPDDEYYDEDLCADADAHADADLDAADELTDDAGADASNTSPPRLETGWLPFADGPAK